MDVDQSDSESVRHQKKCNRKYSQSSQSSTGGINSSIITNSKNEKRGDLTSKSCDVQEVPMDTTDKDIWSSSAKVIKQSSNLSCNNDNSNIDSTLRNKCDNSSSVSTQPIPSASNTCINLKSEVKEEINDSTNHDVDLAPHVVTKLNVSIF